MITAERITEGSLQTADGRPLPLESSRVQAVVHGPAASVELRQMFVNDTDETIEAVYTFPMPHQASVFRMEFHIADRVVKGVVKEKEEARRAYAEARAEGRAATLLEQEKPNLFTLSVANVTAGARIEVVLEYQDLLGFDDGEWRFVFPMTAKEHYGSPQRLASGATVAPPRPRSDERSSPLTLELELHGATLPTSPSHRIEVEPQVYGCRVHLPAGQKVANRDFVVAWRPEGAGIRPNLWFQRDEGRPGSFMLVIPPAGQPDDRPRTAADALRCCKCGAPWSERCSEHNVPEMGPCWGCEYCGVVQPHQAQTVIAQKSREIVFLLDRSYSMRSEGLALARRAILGALSVLSGGDDVFSILAFHHEVEPMNAGWSECDPSSAETFLNGSRPAGGTELEVALRAGAGLPPSDKDRTRVLVLLTDAALGNEGPLLRALPKILGGSRLFVLGVGPATNRFLVDKLALVGRGAADFLVGDEPLVLARFARRLRNCGPVLTDLALDWPDAQPLDVYPQKATELFSGQPLRLVGRYLGTGGSRLVLTGKWANGQKFRQELSVDLPASAAQLPGLERLWARQRIESLADQLVQSPQLAADTRLEVLGLALKHSLLSPYTALVAEDTSVSATPGHSRRVEVEVAEPEAESFGSAATGELDRSVALRSRMAAPAAPPLPVSAAPASSAEPFVDEAEAFPSAWGESDGADAFAACAVMDCLASPIAEPFGASDPFSAASDPLPPLPKPIPPPSLTPPAPRTAGFAPPRPPAPPRGWVPSSRPSQSQAGPKLNHPAYAVSELEWARARPIGQLDLVFLVDETGSMGAYIEQVKRRLLELVAALRQSPLCRSLRLGLVTFRDHPPQEHSFVSRVVPLSDDLAAVETGVSRMQAQGGGDGPEAVTDGLRDLISLDWGERAARVVVLVGDAPPHGVEPTGDGFPQGCPCGRHWFVQAEGCREMGVTVHAVGCAGIERYAGAVDVFRTIATTTGGLYLPLSEAHLLIPLVCGLCDRELDRKRLEEHIKEVVNRHAVDLQKAAPPEQVRFVTETLRASGVQAVDLSGQELCFRELSPDDVELGLEQLRRSELIAV